MSFALLSRRATRLLRLYRGVEIRSRSSHFKTCLSSRSFTYGTRKCLKPTLFEPHTRIDYSKYLPLSCQHVSRWSSSSSSSSSSQQSSRSHPSSNSADDASEEETQSKTSDIWGNVPWWQPIVSEIGTVPNIITMSRIIATPFLGYIIIEGHYDWAFAGVSIFGFTDWLDGYIARKYNQMSVLGTFLDPFADKILIMTLTLAEGYVGLVPAGLAGLIVARDFGLIIGGFYMRAKTKPVGVPFFDTTQASALKVTPSLLSKFNTLFQVMLLTGALLNASLQVGEWGDNVVLGLSALTFVTTIGSGVDYWINRPIKLALSRDDENTAAKASHKTEAKARDGAKESENH